jgi:hypothetical protein
MALSSLFGANPSDGDVLIVSENRPDGASFALGIFPNPTQVRVREYAEAEALALRWADERCVAVWFTDDGRTFKPAPARSEALSS